MNDKDKASKKRKDRPSPGLNPIQLDYLDQLIEEGTYGDSQPMVMLRLLDMTFNQLRKDGVLKRRLTNPPKINHK